MQGKDLISKLLTKDPAKRLGANDGFYDIKYHEWFKDINFSEIARQQMKAPFIPHE